MCALSDERVTHPDREFTEFIDRVEGRVRNSSGRAFMKRNRHIETPAQTWHRRYDAETEELREYMKVQIERKAS